MNPKDPGLTIYARVLERMLEDIGEGSESQRADHMAARYWFKYSLEDVHLTCRWCRIPTVAAYDNALARLERIGVDSPRIVAMRDALAAGHTVVGNYAVRDRERLVTISMAFEPKEWERRQDAINFKWQILLRQKESVIGGMIHLQTETRRIGPTVQEWRVFSSAENVTPGEQLEVWRDIDLD